MTKSGILLISMLIFAFAAMNADEPPQAALKLAETERAFAKAALDSGMVPAFLRYLHDDAVVFRPHPINGKRWYSNRPASSAQLKWWPTFVDVASSGDLGISTGPWEYLSDAADTANVLHGQFVSIWQQQDNGEFLVMADIGISHGTPASKITELSLGQIPTSQDTTKKNFLSQPADEAITEAESTYSVICENDGVAAGFSKYADPEIRVYRDNLMPFFGTQFLESVLSKSNDLMISTMNFVAASKSNDFGYTYGHAKQWEKDYNPNLAAKTSYLRVWKKNLKGEWKITLDIALPMDK